FIDVFGLENELLAKVSRPVGALLLVCPMGGTEPTLVEGNSEVISMKETIGNASECMGLLQAIENFQATYNERSASDYDDCQRKIHACVAREGQTSTPSLEENVDPHSVALVPVDDLVFELGGSKDFPPPRHWSSDEENSLKSSLDSGEG
ncbi:ubiquitin carboxyl-terminal hydrolase isozyme L3-like, partial [Galendromus occidentalis]|uniref:ubiquitinyl hydrolase 1 n=1 Tax=Galendromus occidentalis TaxID=34638 RepID=A0AAJ7SDS4_9ACAR